MPGSTAVAWNAAAAVIFTGTDTVTVEGGPAAAAVVLRPPPGDGTLTLRLSWAGTTVGPQDTVQVESRLQDPGSALDPDVLGFNVAPGARRADYTGAWPAGYYLLTMVMYVNGVPVWGNAYAVQIRAGAVTSRTLTLTQADLRL